MNSHLFISYSTADGLDFAIRLHDALEAPPDAFPAWLDKRDLVEGRNWDHQLRDAIRDCGALLFAMTPDSVSDSSVCYDEWTLALSYKKHVVPLRVAPYDEPPFRLHNKQYIDFTADFDAGMAKLRAHLRFLATPAGELLRLQDQREDARRRLRRARDDAEGRRIQDEIDRLTREDIPRQERLVADPAAAIARTERSIAAGLERERAPEPSAPAAARPRARFVNPPPATAPAYFQDRVVETAQVGRALADPAVRLVTVIGRGGAGKTALVCRLLAALEQGALPDDGGPLPVDGLVYLSALADRRPDFPTLFGDLTRLLPAEAAERLDALYRQPTTSADAKTRALLAEFTPDRAPHGRVVVLLDNFEDATDPETRRVADDDLAAALKALLNAPAHPLKVVITTRIALADLPVVQPGRQRRLDLDAGLEQPYAEALLRELDADGRYGLYDLPPGAPILDETYALTRGLPRALEALHGLLAADSSATLDEVLAELRRAQTDSAAGERAEYVAEVLVGEAFSRLDAPAQRVLQALAIYARPAPPAAVDFLLEAGMPGIDGAPILARLVNMHFARKEAGRFYLHPIDRAYALGRIPRGRPDDGDTAASFTQVALYARAADYFAATRKPRDDWKTLADLQPQLDEFEMRCAGEDWDAAAKVLLSFDRRYLLLWGQLRLVIELHERLAGRVEDPHLQMECANNLGSAHWRMGHPTEAISCLEFALQVAGEWDDLVSEGAYLSNLGHAYSSQGQFDRAIECFEQSLDIARELEDLEGECIDLTNLGCAYSMLDQITRALECHERSLDLNRKIGDRRSEGVSLGHLGNAYCDLEQPHKAIECYNQALTISREFRDRIEEMVILNNLGLTYLELGQFGRAIEYYEIALTVAYNAGDQRGGKRILNALADAYDELGQSVRAAEYREAAYTISRELGHEIDENPLTNTHIIPPRVNRQ